MRLTRLAARDYMAFETLDINLSDIANVVVVGRNGHGKSSLFDVLRYTLFGKGRFKSAREGGSPDQQVRDGTETMWTCVEFTATAGQRVRVERTKTRGKTADIHVWVDDEDISVGTDPISGKATQHTNAESEADIARLVGLPYDTIMAGPWMAQEEASALMRAQASDRLRMLVKLFEAEWCAPLYEAAKADRIAAEAQRASAAAEIERLTKILAREEELTTARARGRAAMAAIRESRANTETALTAVKVKLAEARQRVARVSAIQAEVTRLNGSIKRNTEEWARLSAIVAVAREDLAAPTPMLPDIPQPDAATLAEAEQQLTAARAADTQHAGLVATIDARERDYERAKGARTILSTVPCGGKGEFAACQFLTGVPSREAVADLKGELGNLHHERTTAKMLSDQVPTLAATVKRIQDEAREAASAESRAREAMLRWESRRASALRDRDQHGATIDTLKDQVAADQSQVDALAVELTGIEGDNEAIRGDEAELTVLTEALRTINEKQEQIEPALANIEGQLAMIDEAKSAIEGQHQRELVERARADQATILERAFHITGIPTLIVENGIAAIEDRANELLARLPQDFRIELRTQREKKGGGLMDTLDIIVTTDGQERDYEMLSVGQRFRVDLALRIGLGSVLAARSGNSIETLWLDEPLADLDDEGRAAMVETIGALVTDFGLVVVVSHHPEFNETFDHVIEVVQENSVSEARVA